MHLLDIGDNKMREDRVGVVVIIICRRRLKDQEEKGLYRKGFSKEELSELSN